MNISLFKHRLEFVPPRLQVEEGEWERLPEDERNLQLIELGLHTGVGEVHFRPMLWTATPPTKAGYYWCRFTGSTEREVVRVEAGFDYVAGDIEWSSAPVPTPYEP